MRDFLVVVQQLRCRAQLLRASRGCCVRLGDTNNAYDSDAVGGIRRGDGSLRGWNWAISGAILGQLFAD